MSRLTVLAAILAMALIALPPVARADDTDREEREASAPVPDRRTVRGKLVRVKDGALVVSTKRDRGQWAEVALACDDATVIRIERPLALDEIKDLPAGHLAEVTRSSGERVRGTVVKAEPGRLTVKVIHGDGAGKTVTVPASAIANVRAELKASLKDLPVGRRVRVDQADGKAASVLVVVPGQTPGDEDGEGDMGDGKDRFSRDHARMRKMSRAFVAVGDGAIVLSREATEGGPLKDFTFPLAETVAVHIGGKDARLEDLITGAKVQITLVAERVTAVVVEGEGEDEGE